MWDQFKSHILCIYNEWLGRDSSGIRTICLIAQSHYTVLSRERLHRSHIGRLERAYQVFARPILGAMCRYESFACVNSKLPLIKTIMIQIQIQLDSKL